MRKLLAKTILLFVSIPMSGCAIRGVNIDFVTIGNPGNPGDIRTGKNQYGKPYATPYGCGAVEYKYRISKYEITNDQWNRFADATGVRTNSKSIHKESRQPITSITWREAAYFCNYLTSGDIHLGAYQFSKDNTVTIDRASALLKDRKIYVLPTEDEWYKAAYYNSDRNEYSLYANGLDTLPEADNGWNYDGGEYDEPWCVGTGTKEQNGTYDIMGNVAEWNESYAELNGMPAYAIRGGSFAYRGGFKDYLASYSRSFHYTRGSLNNSFGFRIVSIAHH